MLVDSDSTHKFLEIATAKSLGCTILPMHSHSVAVAGAGGVQLSCNCIRPNFTWTIQGVSFSSDFRVLSLGGCDLVLGVQWLHHIGPVTMDFSVLELAFTYNGQDIVLQGCKTSNKLSFMSLEATHK